jgi:transposase-like protein
MSAKRAHPGQPTKLDPAKLQPLLAAGANDAQIARVLQVDRRTLLNWRRTNPELFLGRQVLRQVSGPRPRFRPAYIGQVKEFYERGMSSAEVAKCLGVHIATFGRWRREYPALNEAVTAGMTAARRQQQAKAAFLRRPMARR